jgi:hypothetical protein
MQAPLGSDGLWTNLDQARPLGGPDELGSGVHQLLEADERLAKRAPPAEPT